MKDIRIPVAKEGVPFIGTLVFWALIFAILGFKWGAALTGLLACFTLYFFRDPERVSPTGRDVICSPADGRIIRIEEVTSGPNVEGPMVQISIFMNIFNCHVNRSPVGGKVREISYRKGSFWPADHKKAFTKNEHNCLVLEDECGRLVEVVQVAGLIARRIVCWAEPGDELYLGDRIGLIRFGSRVDVYLPKDADISVKLGQKVFAGETIIARW